MSTFINENFMLNNKTAIELYHRYAKEMPIIDYHCHLNPFEIAENKAFRNITELWLGGDHYKWRILRSNGVDEKYITGDASDKDKFMKWAETVPYCIGNPAYHWTHLELKRYFDIDELLSLKTVEDIWNTCNDKLQGEDFRAKGLIKQSNVKVVCTTDDPIDDLMAHKKIGEDKNFDTKVLPTFRPDKGINIEKEMFLGWVKKLEEAAGTGISGLAEYKKAIINRIEYFNSTGCKLSDHGLDAITFSEASEKEVEEIFAKALNNTPLNQIEIDKYKTHMLIFFGEQYSKYGWTLQLHIGASRNNNERMFKLIGSDTGFDAINDYSVAEALSKILNNLDKNNALPKTIIYSLNPCANEVIGATIGCFQGGGIPGKIQFGSAWWFNDHKAGMVKQMTDLGNLGLLSRFVGMLTDSRSFISYTRHEYFRRILCNLLGEWVEAGEAPGDMELLGKMVKDISYNNAANYFSF